MNSDVNGIQTEQAGLGRKMRERIHQTKSRVEKGVEQMGFIYIESRRLTSKSKSIWESIQLEKTMDVLEDGIIVRQNELIN